MLGPWDAHWLAACLRYLPDFAVALTAHSPELATALLPVPNLHFSLFNIAFAMPSGSRFLPRARRRGRLLFSWSDNEEVRERAGKFTARQTVFWVVINAMVWVAEIGLRVTKGSPRARVVRELGRISP
ncbi:hypothetical protein F4818DRAFT_443298 [Hypoxylon cercidicola]|nr:hypothetical protein F4818DRAFT_443298 [Hypoxylon cercidicola]